MKRPRPYISYSIRSLVLARQIYESGSNVPGREEGETLKAMVARRIMFLFGDQKVHLDHDPQLALRPYNPRIKNVAARYSPNANDPAALVYRTKPDHHLKSNVRGEHGSRSDTAARVHQRRLDQNRGLRPKRKWGKIPARKHPWPKRPLTGD